MPQVKIKYFGIAQDITGNFEQVVNDQQTLQNLINYLYKTYPALNSPKIKVAYNLEIISQQELEIKDINLSEGDEIVFLPPFAGG